MIAADDLDLVSDVWCSVCPTYLDYGDIAWMDMKTGTMYCPACHTPASREYVVIEWLHERGTSVLHRAEVMKLDMWR